MNIVSNNENGFCELAIPLPCANVKLTPVRGILEIRNQCIALVRMLFEKFFYSKRIESKVFFRKVAIHEAGHAYCSLLTEENIVQTYVSNVSSTVNRLLHLPDGNVVTCGWIVPPPMYLSTHIVKQVFSAFIVEKNVSSIRSIPESYYDLSKKVMIERMINNLSGYFVGVYRNLAFLSLDEIEEHFENITPFTPVNDISRFYDLCKVYVEKFSQYTPDSFDLHRISLCVLKHLFYLLKDFFEQDNRLLRLDVLSHILQSKVHYRSPTGSGTLNKYLLEDMTRFGVCPNQFNSDSQQYSLLLDECRDIIDVCFG